MTTLPSTITMQSNQGDREVEVRSMGATDTPKGDGGRYRHVITRSLEWCGWSKDKVKPHLTSWTMPEAVQSVREEAEKSLSDGIPDQRRTMLRNQAFGMLDSRWVPQIAIGQDVDRPFQRWSKARRHTVDVALCIDSTVCHLDSRERLEARMIVAGGLAGALDTLDYRNAIVAASMQVPEHAGRKRTPRRARIGVSHCGAIVCKDWDEPFSDSCFAHLADTHIRRLTTSWQCGDNAYMTQLTDAEWRELTQAQILIYIGAEGDEVINTAGVPRGAKIGPVGDDVLRLSVNRMRDIPRAMETLSSFFREQFAA